MRHFQLVVPDYDNTGSADNPPMTYLRLGAAWGSNETLSDANRADSLLTGHLEFKDDARDTEGRIKPGKKYYRDDGNAVSESTTTALTGELLTRGGVREHTDGNRISTTRGDCVEVVGGNYKLVIMGRVEGANVGRSWWQSSGGHNHDSTSTPGEVSTISWTASHEDGTWEVVEETVKGEVHSYYQGRTESQFYGPILKSYVGDTVRPAIKEHTHCRKSDSGEVYETKVETTTISGNVTEEVNVIARARDAIYYKAGNTETVELVSGTKTEPVSTFSEHLVAPLITDQASYAAHYEKTGGDFTCKFIAGTTLGVTVGAATTFRWLHMGVGLNFAYSFECTIAAKAEVSIGVWATLACMYKEEVEAVSSAELNLAKIGAGITKLKIHLAKQKLKAMSAKTSAQDTNT